MAWIEKRRGWVRVEVTRVAPAKATPEAPLPQGADAPGEAEAVAGLDGDGVIYRPVRCPRCQSKRCPVYNSNNLPVRYHRCECGHTFKSVEV